MIHLSPVDESILFAAERRTQSEALMVARNILL